MPPTPCHLQTCGGWALEIQEPFLHLSSGWAAGLRSCCCGHRTAVQGSHPGAWGVLLLLPPGPGRPRPRPLPTGKHPTSPTRRRDLVSCSSRPLASSPKPLAERGGRQGPPRAQGLVGSEQTTPRPQLPRDPRTAAGARQEGGTSCQHRAGLGATDIRHRHIAVPLGLFSHHYTDTPITKGPCRPDAGWGWASLALPAPSPAAVHVGPSLPAFRSWLRWHLFSVATQPPAKMAATPRPERQPAVLGAL